MGGRVNGSAIQLIEQIGAGGMSTVWKAFDPSRNKIIAVKILADQYSSNGRDIESFRQEERVMEEIDSPWIVKAYAFEHVGNKWRILMEYVDGYTFSDLLQRKQHIKESDCLLICESVAAALDLAWNDHGIVHCDIKPENIMINSDGVVKLTDLGIFHRYDHSESKMEISEHVTGTPAYISPEQIYGDVQPDCRADIYSLAATVYHLATGRTLFPGLDNDATMRAHCDRASQARDPRCYRPSLSEGFCQLLEAMLVKDRDQRISSWKDVYEMCLEVEKGMRFKSRDNASQYPSSLKISSH
jgi:serine/threonine-protein kinase